MFEELIVAERLEEEVVESVLQVQQRLNIRDRVFGLMASEWEKVRGGGKGGR